MLLISMESFKYKYDVFISYSRKDTNVVDKICKAFDDNNISYFIDRKGIGGGLEFPKILAEAILSSQIFLFIASENSYGSKFTQSEVVFAFNKKQKSDIIPYIIDERKLPPEYELTFSAINWRERSKHPIETTLVDDVLRRVGKTRMVELENNYGVKCLFNKNKKKIILSCVIIGSVLFLFTFKDYFNKREPAIEESSVEVRQSSVVDSICNNPLLGVFSYTGPIDENLYPHGKGVAKFGNGDIYQGKFEHGFNDFTIEELTEILASLLYTEYQLNIASEAKANIQRFIEKAKANETKESPVNARTIFHLAQTIAHITQLRLVSSEEERIVTLQDVTHFKWDNKMKGKVGFV